MSTWRSQVLGRNVDLDKRGWEDLGPPFGLPRGRHPVCGFCAATVSPERVFPCIPNPRCGDSLSSRRTSPTLHLLGPSHASNP